MQLSQKEKRKVPALNKDELKVRKLLLKLYRKIFPKQEMQIKDDVKNQIKKINNPKAEREKDDSIQGK